MGLRELEITALSFYSYFYTASQYFGKWGCIVGKISPMAFANDFFLDPYGKLARWKDVKKNLGRLMKRGRI